MGRHCAGVGLLLRISALLSCLILAWSDIRAAPNRLTDEEWEAGLGTDMFPEKAAIPDFVVASGDPVAQKKETEVSQMMQLLGRQSAQIEQLSDIIARLDDALQRLPLQSLVTPQATDTIRARKQKVGHDEVVIPVLPQIPSPNEIHKPTDGNRPAEAEVKPAHANELPKDLQVGDGGSEGLTSSYPVTDKRRQAQGGGGYGLGGGMTVARYKPAWTEHFQFVSAVKVDADVSCLHVLPHEGDDGMSRYVAVGDATGHVYIFFIHGDLLVDYVTLSQAPVTAMLSFNIRKNETWLVTGHADGSVLVHRIWEIVQRGGSSGDDAHNLEMEYAHSLVNPPLGGGVYDLGAMFDSTDAVDSVVQSGEAAAGESSGSSKLITHLEMYRVGKMRYVLVTDSSGKMQVFRENATLFGVADSLSRPLAFLRTPNTQRLLFLTKSGAGSLDLRSMTVRSCPCDGLNGSTVVAYTFDAAGRSRAYGFTTEGDLVYVALSGDTLHFECHARTTKRKVDIEGPVSPHGIKGYLLVSTPKQVFVYNTTLQVGFSYANIRGGGGPRPLFGASMDDIGLSFLATPIAQGKWPMMACNRDKLVVLGFGGGYVGIYRSNLPVYKLPDFNAKLWSSPIFISVLLLLGAWQLLSRKRDPVSIDNPVMQLGSSSSASGFRKYEEVARPGFRETRESSLGESRSLSESRRFESPSRAYGSKGGTYGPGSMSYRSSSSDPGGYSTRREPLFANQTVGDMRH